MASFEKIVRGYLKQLQSEWNDANMDGEHTAELSFHPCLDSFFKKLADELAGERDTCVVFEPRNQARMGRPDWRVHDRETFGVYGYIEAKGLSLEPFDMTSYKGQFDRYLSLGHRLAITDGIDFVYAFEQGCEPQCVSVVDKGLLKFSNWSDLEVNPKFEFVMRRFFSEPVPRYCDEESLVEQVALRTRYFADIVTQFASVPLDEAVDDAERDAIILLDDLKSFVYEHGDLRMRTAKVFADFVAQTVMFTLLYAYRMVCSERDSANDKHAKIRNFLVFKRGECRPLSPFLMVMNRIGAYGDKNFIMTWADECIRFLSYVHMTDEQKRQPDYHGLFEHFLSKFDPDSRFDYGAFYTPRELASCVVRLANEIADDEFDGASIFDDGNTPIDPCCGTGSFLEQLRECDDGHGRYLLCGIEVLPAPYMLATYRMAMLDGDSGRASPYWVILLANTLIDRAFNTVEEACTVEGVELSHVNEVSSRPITLVVGNPPSSDSFRKGRQEGFSFMDELLEDFRPPKKARHGRQNIQKQISNPFVQFLRWACFKLESNSGPSMLAYVVPNSFLENDSYRYARKYIVEHFDLLWVLSVDADARAGIRSDSVFNTQQGRAVMIAVRKCDEASKIHTYRYLDLSGKSRDEKIEYFEKDACDLLGSFVEYPVNLSDCSFVPLLPFDQEAYARYWPVSGDAGQEAIFKSYCSGIKLAPSSLFTHAKKSMLKRRCREILSEGMPAAKKWLGRQDKFPREDEIREFAEALAPLLKQGKFDAVFNQNTFEYAFRPFVTIKAFLWEDLLKRFSHVGGGGTRRRPELMKAYSGSETLGFALSHSPKDQKGELRQFASFCWHRPDNDLCRRGNSFLYLNQYPVGKRGDGKLESNVNERLCAAVSSLLGVGQGEASTAIVFYTYAILCSQVYLDEFEGALYTVNRADMRPRIPIANDSAVFRSLSDIGRRLAMLEKSSYRPSNVIGFDYDKLCACVPKDFKLHWAKGLQPFDEGNETVSLSGIDGEVVTVPCPIEVQHVVIAGYEVVKNAWIKFNSYEFTHCSFTKDDMRSFLDLLNKLFEYVRLVRESDEMVRQLLRPGFSLILPNANDR